MLSFQTPSFAEADFTTAREPISSHYNPIRRIIIFEYNGQE